MGFSTLAVSIGSESVFSNPANLARFRNPRSRDGIHEIHFPRFSITAPEAELMPIGEKLVSSPESTVSDLLARQSGTGNSETSVAAQVFPSIVFGGKSAPTFLIGAYGDSKLRILHEAEASPTNFEVLRDTTLGAALSVSGSTRAGTFAYGVTLRPNARYFARQTDFQYNPEEPSDDSSSESSSDPSSGLLAGSLKLDRTIGIGVDAGILFTAADFWLPTFALAIRNAPIRCVPEIYNPYRKKNQTLCGSSRTGATQPGETRTLIDPTELGLGFSITPRSRIGTDKLNLRLSAEASPIGVPSGESNYGYVDVPLDRMLRVGGELFFGHPLYAQGFAIRGGVFAGSPTWGLTAELWVLQLEYASYEQETLFKDGTTLKKRQHMVGISTRW
jgi:hypothetical protein